MFSFRRACRFRRLSYYSACIFCFGALQFFLPVDGAFAQPKHTQTSFIAAPWTDAPTPEHSNTKACAFSVQPVHSEDDLPRRGTFVQFKMGKEQYIARTSLFNSRFTTLEIFRLDVSNDKVRFILVASTKLDQEALDAKAFSCTDSEAYLIITVTSESQQGSSGQLFIFRHSGGGSAAAEDFILMHSEELAGVRGIADVSVSCYQENVIFATAQSITLIPSNLKKVTSSVLVWNPQSRAVVASLTADTTNAASVVAFESGPCLILVFGQASSRQLTGPLDTLLYCLSSTSRTQWKFSLIQAVNLCDVHGLSLFSNSKNEMGILVAVARKAREHELCPVAPLTMIWNGKEMGFSSNITVQNVASFHPFPSQCCSLLFSRQIDMEKSLRVVGSTDVMFEDVRKFDIFTVDRRTFFLLSFTSSSQQSALHEFVCGGQVGITSQLMFGPGNYSVNRQAVRPSNASEGQAVAFQPPPSGNMPESMSAALMEAPPVGPPVSAPPAHDRAAMGSLPKSPPPVSLLKSLSPQMQPGPNGVSNFSNRIPGPQAPMIMPATNRNFSSPRLPPGPSRNPSAPGLVPQVPSFFPFPNGPTVPVPQVVSTSRNHSRRMPAPQLRPQNGTRKVVLNRRVPLTPVLERDLPVSKMVSPVLSPTPEIPMVENAKNRVRRNLTRMDAPRFSPPGLRNESSDFDADENPAVYLPGLTAPRIIPPGGPKKPLVVPLRAPQRNRTIVKMQKVPGRGKPRNIANRTRPFSPFEPTQFMNGTRIMPLPRIWEMKRRGDTRNLTLMVLPVQQRPPPLIPSMRNMTNDRPSVDPRGYQNPPPGPPVVFYNMTRPGNPTMVAVNPPLPQNIRMDLARNVRLPQRRKPLRLRHGLQEFA